MSTENVKIVINENDKTSPLSNAVTSSDIAFVPGFSIKGNDAPSEPTLCSTLREFQEKFGNTPATINGQEDKSYIYAAELINEGMPVVYYACSPVPISDQPTNVEPMSVTADSSSSVSISWAGASNNIIEIVTNEEEKGFDINVDFPPLSVSADSSEIYTLKVYPVSDPSFITDSELVVGLDETYEPFTTLIVDNSKTTVLLSNNSTEGMSLSPSISAKIHVDAYKTGTVVVLLQTQSVSFSLPEDCFDTILDRNEYSVKYITSGAHPALTVNSSIVFDLCARDMMTVAKTRGDAVAIIDVEDTSSTPLTHKSLYEAVEGKLTEDIYKDVSSYGTCMYPEAEYYCPTVEKNVVMPASFGYLMCVARAIKTSPNWLAMAGVSRGLVPNIKRQVSNETLTNTIAEHMQPKFGKTDNQISINCITNVRPYGLTLWGNRTLKSLEIDKGTTATHFLNIRNMISDIKKVLYSTAKTLMFEQNTDTLWMRFKSSVSPLLNQLKSGGGISDYKIIKTATKYDGTTPARGKICATIRIYPIYAVEYFELTVEISDQDVTISPQ